MPLPAGRMGRPVTPARSLRQVEARHHPRPVAQGQHLAGIKFRRSIEGRPGQQDVDGARQYPLDTVSGGIPLLDGEWQMIDDHVPSSPAEAAWARLALPVTTLAAFGLAHAIAWACTGGRY